MSSCCKDVFGVEGECAGGHDRMKEPTVGELGLCGPMDHPAAELLCGTGENACAPGCCKEKTLEEAADEIVAAYRRRTAIELTDPDAKEQLWEAVNELSATTPEPEKVNTQVLFDNVTPEVAQALQACRPALEAGHTLVALPFQPTQEQVDLLHRIAKGPESILMEAERITNGQREKDYGLALDNHERIADAWNAYLKHDPDQRFGLSPNLLPEDVACLMILLKIARYQVSGTRDSAVDIAGYANVLDKMGNQRKDRWIEMADEL